jgi:hypothetical protein
VLSDLFKTAMNSFEKGELDGLNDEALRLFEELEAFMEKEGKFPVSQLQNKIFKALDTK